VSPRHGSPPRLPPQEVADGLAARAANARGPPTTASPDRSPATNATRRALAARAFAKLLLDPRTLDASRFEPRPQHLLAPRAGHEQGTTNLMLPKMRDARGTVSRRRPSHMLMKA
jgi:hypothetical protein